MLRQFDNDFIIKIEISGFANLKRYLLRGYVMEKLICMRAFKTKHKKDLAFIHKHNTTLYGIINVAF